MIYFRLALLDDVYKQIRADSSVVKQANGTPPFRRIDGTSMNADSDVEVGVASGYAIQHAIPSGFVSPQNHANDNDFEPHHRYAVAGNKAGLKSNDIFYIKKSQIALLFNLKFLFLLLKSNVKHFHFRNRSFFLFFNKILQF